MANVKSIFNSLCGGVGAFVLGSVAGLGILALLHPDRVSISKTPEEEMETIFSLKVTKPKKQ